MAALLGVFARAGLTFRENLVMLGHSRRDAETDSLTGLGNRRKLMLDLQAALAPDVAHDARAKTPRSAAMVDPKASSESREVVVGAGEGADREDQRKRISIRIPWRRLGRSGPPAGSPRTPAPPRRPRT